MSDIASAVKLGAMNVKPKKRTVIKLGTPYVPPTEAERKANLEAHEAKKAKDPVAPAPAPAPAPKTKLRVLKESSLERRLMDRIAGLPTVQMNKEKIVWSPSDQVKKAVLRMNDGFHRDTPEENHLRLKIDMILKYLKTTDEADHQKIYDLLRS